MTKSTSQKRKPSGGPPSPAAEPSNPKRLRRVAAEKLSKHEAALELLHLSADNLREVRRVAEDIKSRQKRQRVLRFLHPGLAEGDDAYTQRMKEEVNLVIDQLLEELELV